MSGLGGDDGSRRRDATLVERGVGDGSQTGRWDAEIAGPIFIIVYEDRDVEAEVFGGEQAEACARQRFEQVLTNWNASLFQRIDDGERGVTALRREEEKGYAKGVQDMQAELSLTREALDWAYRELLKRNSYLVLRAPAEHLVAVLETARKRIVKGDTDDLRRDDQES